jgi:hypothetical protein
MGLEWLIHKGDLEGFGVMAISGDRGIFGDAHGLVSA